MWTTRNVRLEELQSMLNELEGHGYEIHEVLPATWLAHAWTSVPEPVKGYVILSRLNGGKR